MYTKDKSQRITLRLNEEQFGFVKENAETLGVSPSDFLRMVINAALFSARKMAENENLSKALAENAVDTAMEMKRQVEVH